MTVELKDIVDLVNAIAWPLVVTIALYALHKPLAKFISELGGRATKVSIFQFAIELATIPEFKPSWSVGTFDARQLSPASVFDSTAQALFDQIADSAASDYAIIDLGTEKDWLTSRLYIFAVMLQRMRNLKCFVFLETRGDVSGRFLGIATPDQVRWVLAQRYPWLEAAFAEAYSSISPKPPVAAGVFIFSEHGALQSYIANSLARNFIAAIQQNAPPPPPDEKDWVSLEQPPPQPPLWERAMWLDGDVRTHILNPILQKYWVLDSVDIPSNQRARAILRREGQYVALVDQDMVFKGLVDRQTLVEQVAKHFSEPTEDESPSS